MGNPSEEAKLEFEKLDDSLLVVIYQDKFKKWNFEDGFDKMELDIIFDILSDRKSKDIKDMNNSIADYVWNEVINDSAKTEFLRHESTHSDIDKDVANKLNYKFNQLPSIHKDSFKDWMSDINWFKINDKRVKIKEEISFEEDKKFVYEGMLDELVKLTSFDIDDRGLSVTFKKGEELINIGKSKIASIFIDMIKKELRGDDKLDEISDIKEKIEDWIHYLTRREV